MLYIGIIVGIIVIIITQTKRNDKNENTEHIPSPTVTSKKIVIFLVGVMALTAIGGTKLVLFKTIGDFAFIALVLYFGYILFKKLFMK